MRAWQVVARAVELQVKRADVGAGERAAARRTRRSGAIAGIVSYGASWSWS
jgi:hypothetical protein